MIVCLVQHVYVWAACWLGWDQRKCLPPVEEYSGLHVTMLIGMGPCVDTTVMLPEQMPSFATRTNASHGHCNLFLMLQTFVAYLAGHGNHILEVPLQ